MGQLQSRCFAHTECMTVLVTSYAVIVIKAERLLRKRFRHRLGIRESCSSVCTDSRIEILVC